MSVEKLIAHWVEGSDKNFEDMMAIYEAKRYDWALYIGHLSLEKLFKALYIKVTGKREVPFIHDLIKLARFCNLGDDQELIAKLAEINLFNIEAKYETEKKEFYKRCTKEYTETQIKIIKEIREWLRKKLTNMS